MHVPLIALIAGLSCLALPAQAQQCAPLTRAFSLDLTPSPGGFVYSVPIGVGGLTKQFALSTRSFNSTVSREVVTELKLSTREAGTRFYANGTTSGAQIARTDLTIGPMKAPQHELWVAEGSTGPFDGFLGTDLMQNYDIEMDFAGRKLNYFLTDHCEGKVVYWPSQGFTTVDFKGWDDNSVYPLRIRVNLDGHDVYAEVSSVISETILDADTARSLFNVTPDSPGAVPLGAVDNNPAHRMFGWTFKSLKIGGLSISNAKMRVIPETLGSRDANMLRADSRVRRITDDWQPAMRIGMDVLPRLHLYIATKERKIYITPASAPVQAAAPTPAAPN